jgi:O-antigen ligase
VDYEEDDSNWLDIPDPLVKKGKIAFVLFTLSIGTFIRSADVESKSLDIAILLQLALAGIASLYGLKLLHKYGTLGIGAKSYILFTLWSFVTALFSSQKVLVIGYSILLLGMTLIVAGLIAAARKPQDLWDFEKLWYIIMTISLTKDATLSIAVPSFNDAYTSSVWRLGNGIIHPIIICFEAGACFYMSMRKDPFFPKYLLYGLRIYLLVMVALTRARLCQIIFILQGASLFWLTFSRGRITNMRQGVVMILMVLGMTGYYAIVNEWEGTDAAVNLFNRGQSAEQVASMSGRDNIHERAIARIVDENVQMVLGHGYGTSFFVLKGNDKYGFHAVHCHNGFLEVLLNFGIVGFAIFLIYYLYCISWFLHTPTKQKVLGKAFTNRCIIFMLGVFIYSINEGALGMKATPISGLFIMLICYLDKYKIFMASGVTAQSEEDAEKGEELETPLD